MLVLRTKLLPETVGNNLGIEFMAKCTLFENQSKNVLFFMFNVETIFYVCISFPSKLKQISLLDSCNYFTYNLLNTVT